MCGKFSQLNVNQLIANYSNGNILEQNNHRKSIIRGGKGMLMMFGNDDVFEVEAVIANPGGKFYYTC